MRIFGFDPLDELALFGISPDNGIGMAIPLLQCGLFQIESEPRFAHLRIRTVTAEAMARQNRLHVLVEVERLRGGDMCPFVVTTSRGNQHCSSH